MAPSPPHFPRHSLCVKDFLVGPTKEPSPPRKKGKKRNLSISPTQIKSTPKKPNAENFPPLPCSKMAENMDSEETVEALDYSKEEVETLLKPLPEEETGKPSVMYVRFDSRPINK